MSRPPSCPPDDEPLTVRALVDLTWNLALERAAEIAEGWLASSDFIEDDVAGACRGIAAKIRAGARVTR